VANGTNEGARIAAELTDVDLHRALSVVAEGAALNASGPFGLPTLEQLGALIDCDYLSYVEFEFETNRESFRADLRSIEFLPAIDEAGVALCAFNPLREKSVGEAEAPLILSDLLSAHQRRRNPFYTEVMRPYRVEHELKLFVPAPRGTSRGFTFTRGPGRDFCERDRDLLTLLRPHLTRLRQRWGESFRVDCLTTREHTIMRLVATGLTNRQIAAHLIISPGTVRTHLDHIYRKLDVHTRSAAVAATT
jgi:DNA-binding CsgD family transcriptional regulator